MKLAEKVLNLFEMSNLVQDDTGLDRVIWVSAKTGREKHGPRIKVQKTKTNKIIAGDWFTVTISDEPTIIQKTKQIKISNKEFSDIKNFINSNREILLQYWNSEISTKEMLTRIESLK